MNSISYCIPGRLPPDFPREPISDVSFLPETRRARVNAPVRMLAGFRQDLLGRRPERLRVPPEGHAPTAGAIAKATKSAVFAVTPSGRCDGILHERELSAISGSRLSASRRYARPGREEKIECARVIHGTRNNYRPCVSPEFVSARARAASHASCAGRASPGALFRGLICLRWANRQGW